MKSCQRTRDHVSRSGSLLRGYVHHSDSRTRLQKQAQGRVVPDAFTHGTSEQRMRWFMKGLRSGKLEDGDTFSIPYDSL